MTLEPLIDGFRLFFDVSTLLAIAFGTLVGLLIGVLPGLGPLMGIILLLPLAYHMEPVAGMGLLVSIFVAGSCGGAITAIMVRIPGTPLAAATLLDGYPMMKRGLAKEAIGTAVAASALGGIIGGLILIFLAPLLADIAIDFAPPEYFALTLTGLLTIAVVSREATVKGLMTGTLGLVLSTIGYDEFANVSRFAFGIDGLLGGINLVAMVVGIFAISEIIDQIRHGDLSAKPDVSVVRPSFSSAISTMRHWRNLVRSSVIGTGLGALPGIGGGISAFSAYAIAKSASKRPEEFGTGIADGVVATESANNATVGGTLIPTLALGIPGDASSAVLMGALILLGFFPGPGLFEKHQDIVGGIFWAYMAANVMMFFVGILLTPLFVACIKLQKRYLLPLIMVLCVMGVYSLESSVFDLWVMLVFGLVGYALRRFDYPLPPLVIGLVLGPVCEGNFRRSLIISGGHYDIFFSRPIATTIIVVNILLVLWMLIPKSLKQRVFRRLGSAASEA
ncbi:tripartite tricarboxylate transporter permease [Pararhizobium mangrovi]|uniref:Tripartite tricarboxylate transporter protein TctA n=1 Tax=Pararhizobium mangrovi TaxID=2590452 RepID=A0A506UFR6_9HYPH|nr:tripartite tricarboxylate transporter permease [Pararhizobium mangrovi]TPW31875.1 tripartite tricarboxylate transporter protein TctA [Pararhizobium mangrovi]